MIFLLTQRTRLSATFQNLEHVGKSYRKFSRAFEKSFQLRKKLRFSKNEIEMKLEYSDKTSLFELKTFFKGS